MIIHLPLSSSLEGRVGNNRFLLEKVGQSFIHEIVRFLIL